MFIYHVIVVLIVEALEQSGVINGIGCTIIWSQIQHIVIYA